MNKPILREKVSEDILVQINLAGKRFKRRIVGQDFQRQRGPLFHADSRRGKASPFPVPRPPLGSLRSPLFFPFDTIFPLLSLVLG